MISKSHLNEISPCKGKLCVHIHYSPWLEISTSPGPLQLFIPSYYHGAVHCIAVIWSHDTVSR